jgi:Domain of unknown function (DUF6473)
MAYLTAGAGAPDFASCQYGASKLVFRGPQRSLVGRYVAVIGGTETFGKYVAQPFSDHLETALGVPVVNLGVANAGPEVLLADAEIARIATGAQAVVLQLVGAQNQSNRFYAVHPRRNDRLLGVTQTMRALFPEVDFTEFHFTRHLLQSLYRVNRERFALVVAELQDRWQDRTMALIQRLGPGSVVFWAAAQPPLTDASGQFGPRYPAFVDRAMVDRAAQLAPRFLELCPPVERPAPDDFLQHVAAEAGVMGLRAHRSVADRLVPLLRDMGV